MRTGGRAHRPEPSPARGGVLATALAATVAVIGFVALTSGGGACYDPKIRSGGLRCAAASTGKRCPDGFSCVGDVCVTTRAGAGGADGGMCMNPIAPLCQPSGGTGACDPVCQLGCACGLRCNVSGSAVACVAPLGKKTLGQKCDPRQDDCDPGFICLLETCGTNFGRCYRYCRSNGACGGGGGACNTTVLDGNGADTGEQVCDLARQECDPYAQTGCLDSSLRCFVVGATGTICDCPAGPPRERGEGQPCGSYDECAAGLACLDQGGTARCLRLCRTVADCATCTVLGNIRFCAQ